MIFIHLVVYDKEFNFFFGSKNSAQISPSTNLIGDQGIIIKHKRGFLNIQIAMIFNGMSFLWFDANKAIIF